MSKSLNIAYFAPGTIHDAKWINYFAEKENVFLFTRWDFDDLDKSYFSTKIKFYPILKPYSIINNNKQVKLIKTLVSKHNIHLAHALYANPYAFWVHKLDLPYIITTRGSDVLIDLNHLSGSKKSLKSVILNYILYKRMINVLNKAYAITATSLKQIMKLNLITKQNINLKLIRTGVDFKSLPIENEEKNNVFKVLSCRNLMPFFNIHIIIKAFNELMKSNKDLVFELHIINNFNGTEYSKNIMRLIHDLGISKSCHFYPQLEKSNLSILMNRCDLVVMVPNSDGTPNSALEAMYLKTPVLLGAHDYDKDIFNNKSVWKINKNNTKELFKKMNDVLKIKKSDKNSKLEYAYKLALSKGNFELEIKKIERIYNSIRNRFK